MRKNITVCALVSITIICITVTATLLRKHDGQQGRIVRVTPASTSPVISQGQNGFVFVSVSPDSKPEAVFVGNNSAPNGSTIDYQIASLHGVTLWYVDVRVADEPVLRYLEEQVTRHRGGDRATLRSLDSKPRQKQP
jgi:hypothetical protein